MADVQIALRIAARERPAIEVRVNFGLFAGRHATPAEIDQLAAALRGPVSSFSVVSEERHEFGGTVEASLHQVVIEVPADAVAADADALADRIVAAAEDWATACIASRHGGGEL
jgi:hypothetical protein